jgi:hypothetical protein
MSVGFNAMQPGKVKKGDLVMLGAAVLVLIALIVWVAH